MKKNLGLGAWNALCWSQGNWVGTKGAAGYDLAGWDGPSDVSYMPGVMATLVEGSRYQWAAQTTDPRALEGPNDSTRSAGTYCDHTQIRVQVHFSAAYSGHLRLYAVDWDKQNRRETITVNGQTATLAGDFSQGAWIFFPVDVAAGGTVTIAVAKTAGINAVLSGIFLGDAGPPPPPITFSNAPQGSWVGIFGSGGYDLAGWEGSAGDLSSLSNVSLSLAQGGRYRWTASFKDNRALQAPNGSVRSVAAYASSRVQALLTFSVKYSGNVELYALDWDKQNRRETMTVNGQTAVLSTDFSQGVWVSFPVRAVAGGEVTITVDRTAGINAVLSGIFLG